MWQWPWRRTIKVKVYKLFTVTGSSRGESISACFKNTFPRHALHNIRSKAGMRSRSMTPATNLQHASINSSVKVLVHGLEACASICFQHCGVQSPSLPLPSPLFPSIPHQSPPLLFPSLRSSPLNLARGSGERCKLSQWCVGRSPSRQRFCCILRVKERCWWHSRCTVSNNRKRIFLTFYEEIFQELTIAFIL